MSTLHWSEWLILTGFIMFSLAIGLFHGCTGGKQRTTAEFLMGNRKLQMLPTMMSLLVSYMSAILVLGAPAEMYTRGTMAAIWEMTGKCVGILFAERFVIPWIYRMQLISVNEYFERRYDGKSVRVVGSLLSILNSIVYMGVSIYAPSVALEAASGVSSEWSMSVIAAVCVVYTAMGGIKAVVWTDVFQFFIMMAGILAVLIKVVIVTGHVDVYDVTRNASRIQWVNFDPNPQTRHTVWGFLFGASWMWFFMYGTAQPSVQRISAVRSLGQARWIALLNIPFSVVMFGCSYVTGVLIFVYFYDRKCDPLASGMVHSPNQIVVTFVMEAFQKYKGFSGLFLATLFSGSASSVSSSLSAATANAWEDLLKHRLSVSEQQAAYINKVLVVIYGFLATGVGFMVFYTGGPVIQIASALMAATAAPMGTMLLLGGTRYLQRHIEPIGACCGGIAGLAINVWISVGRAFTRGSNPLPPVDISGCVYPFNETFPQTPPLETHPLGIEHLYRVSYIWTGPIGAITTVLVTLFVSRIALCFYKPVKTNVPDDLFMTARHACYIGEVTISEDRTTGNIELTNRKVKSEEGNLVGETSPENLSTTGVRSSNL